MSATVIYLNKPPWTGGTTNASLRPIARALATPILREPDAKGVQDRKEDCKDGYTGYSVNVQRTHR